MPTKITIDGKAIADMYFNKGMSVGAIADKLGVHPQTISNRLRENGHHLRRSLHPVEGFDLPEAIRLYYGEGYSLQSVAKVFGVSTNKVKAELLDSGHKLRGCWDYWGGEPTKNSQAKKGDTPNV